MGLFQDVVNKVSDKVSGGSSKSDYGLNAKVTIKVDGQEITNKKVSVTDLMVETGVYKEAGVCEVRIQAALPRVVKELPYPKSDMSKIKVGHTLEILIANSNGNKLSKPQSVFTGFVESLEVSFSKELFTGIIHGMDAKMWMMANQFTGERGKKAGYKKIAKSVLSSYSKQTKTGKVNVTSSAKMKGTCYQIDESDYGFLCRIADVTGSLFFIDNKGKAYFSSPESLISKTDNIVFGDNSVCNVSLKTSVWGTVKSVKVTATSSTNSDEKIEATSSSAKSIGSGKSSSRMISMNYSSPKSGVRCISIYDDSIQSQQEAKALADAVYTKREEQLAEVELLLSGNPKLTIGKGIVLKGFGDPFDGKYLAAGVRHVYGIYSDDGQYHTILTLRSNRSNL